MRSRGTIVLLAVCVFVIATAQMYLMGVPEDVAASVGVDLSQVSLLVTVYTLANGIGAPALVVATSRWSQRSQLLFSLVLCVPGLVLMACSNNFAILLASRALMGATIGTFVSTSYAVAARLAGPGHEATGIADVALGFGAAAVFAMPIARLLRSFIDWHWAYGVMALLSALVALVISRVLPRENGRAPSTTLGQRLASLADRRVLLALSVTLVAFTGFSCVYTFVAPLIDAVCPGIGAGASIILSLLGVADLVGTKLSSVMAEHLGNRISAFAIIGLQIVGLVCIWLFIPLHVAFAVPLCVWLGASWALVPVQNVVVSKLAGAAGGMAITLATSMQQLGQAAGSAVAGIVVAGFSVTATPLVALPLALLALVLEALLFKRAGDMCD